MLTRSSSGDTASSYFRRHSMRLSTPPRDVASLKSRSCPGKALAASSVPSSTARQPPKPPGIWRLATSWQGLDGNDAWCTACTRPARGCAAPPAPVPPCSHAARRAAVSDWRCARRWSVLMDRMRSHTSMEPGVEPNAMRSLRKAAAASGAAVHTTPPRASECPAKYFVVACTTKSAPSASGRCSGGGAKVPSTTTRWAPRAAAT
mmetsp:Transcript_112724/g.313361  ORF Transcript_112724/g.313361 Transcript_112724/m.313361 type:complete len:205 (-) Transcript_112724:382-996(-)